jgi:hypothetical protein
VRAASTSDPAVAAEVRIRITPAAKRTARPDPWPNLTAGRKLLSPVRARPLGRRVVLAKVVTGRRAGRVVMTATHRGEVLGRCASRVAARTGFTCKLTLRRARPMARVRVTAKLTTPGGATAVRRAFVTR